MALRLIPALHLLTPHHLTQAVQRRHGHALVFVGNSPPLGSRTKIQSVQDQRCRRSSWRLIPPACVMTTPLLALGCNPALIPFPFDDLPNPLVRMAFVGALVQGTKVAGGQSSIKFPSHDILLLVSVSLDGKLLTCDAVPLNGSTDFPFSLSRISLRLNSYALSCTATLSTEQPSYLLSQT